MSIRSAARNLRRASRNASSGVDRRAGPSSASARWSRVGPRVCGGVGAGEFTGSALHADRPVSRMQQFRAVLQTARLNILDELYLHLDRADEPFSVHVEVQAEGSIDPDRLHPPTRAAAPPP